MGHEKVRLSIHARKWFALIIRGICAWGCEQRLVLAQIATDAKSIEIIAVPKFLKLMTQKCAILTADAPSYQRSWCRYAQPQPAGSRFRSRRPPSPAEVHRGV